MADLERANVADSGGRSDYRLAWAAVLVGAVGASGVLLGAGMVVRLSALLPYGALLSLLFGAHYIYSRRRPNIGIALATGSVGLMIAAALLAGIIANAGLRLRYPLIDGALARFDLLLGIDTPAVVLAAAARPWFADLLGLAYVSIFPLAFATAIWLSFRRQAQLVWEFTLAFGAGIVVAAIVAAFFPAVGNIAYAGLEHLAGAGLPGGSGVYHLQEVDAYRNGADPLLDVRKLDGVVTFPSFHIVMAVAVAHAFRTTPWLAWPMTGWCALVGLSCVPIGGHYVIDLLAGVGLWTFCRFLPRAIRKPVPWAPALQTWKPELS